MNNPHRCVIDSQRMYVTLVLVKEIEGKKVIEGYVLKEGETLVRAVPPASRFPTSFKWNGTNWDDLRTPEEIEAAKPTEIPYTPSEVEMLATEVTELFMAVQVETDQKIAQAMVEISEFVEAAVGGGN